ncbi:LysR family transcriptional regulator [Frateuria aurantia]
MPTAFTTSPRPSGLDPRVELRHLRYFSVVAEELHFSRAADRLGLSQPPLSQQIRQLESYLGAALFARSRRRVELTEAGRLLYPLALDILRRVEDAADQVLRVENGEIGDLRIGFTRATALSVELPRAVRHLRLQFPRLQLLLQEMNSLQQVDALVDGRLDVGVMRHGALPDSLTSRHLLDDPLVVVMRTDDPALHGHADGHSLSLRRLALRDFVMFSRSVGAGIYDDVQMLCQRAGFRPRIIQEAGESNTILALVTAGMGVSILPASYARIGSEELRFIHIDDEAAQSGIHVVHRRAHRQPMIERFAQLLTGPLPVPSVQGNTKST